MFDYEDIDDDADDSLDTVDGENEERSGSDKRVYQRVKLVVEVGVGSQNKFWNGLTENISKGGLFVVTESPFEVGDELTVNLELKGRKGAQAVQCVVCWLREFPDGGLLPGMGLRFTDLSLEQAAAIKKYIETQDLEVLFWEADDA
jgi:uncharacterized protein (TIGR02266 family)